MNSKQVVSTFLILLGSIGLIVLLVAGARLLGDVLEAIKTFGIAVRDLLDRTLLFSRWNLIALGLLAVVGAAWFAYTYWFHTGRLDYAKIRPPACVEVHDRSGAVFDYFCPFNGIRLWRPLPKISKNLRDLVVLLEDAKFYAHEGLDVDEIWNSIETDIERRKFVRGASTITQQLAKNLFLTKDKTVLRKATEIPLTIRLENELTKSQILELYLNTIEWGDGIYGVETASRLYFDHDAASLSDEEAWLLALMIPNPKELNLWTAPKAKDSILKRAKRLSQRLYLEHRMSRADAGVALERFERFIENWMASPPDYARAAARSYPPRWKPNSRFSVTTLNVFRRSASTLLKKDQAVQTHLDRAMQFALEQLLPPGFKPSEKGDLAAVFDSEGRIRGLIGLPASRDAILASARGFAESQGLRLDVLSAKSLSSKMLLD